jgi:hypothetical protein
MSSQSSIGIFDNQKHCSQRGGVIAPITNVDSPINLFRFFLKHRLTARQAALSTADRTHAMKAVTAISLAQVTDGLDVGTGTRDGSFHVCASILAVALAGRPSFIEP